MNTAEITRSTLDVRGGRALEQAADDIRAQAIGSTLIEWWVRGGAQCYITLWDRDRINSQRIDLRAELLRALQVNRRSAAAGILSIAHGFAMVGKKPNRETLIGRDLVDWFVNGHHTSRQGFDLRVQINQAVARMQAGATQ